MHSPNTYNRIFKGSVFMRVLKIFDKQTYVHLCNIIFAFCNKKLPKATYLGELLCEIISLFYSANLAKVAFPATPSTRKPLTVWKVLTADSVRLP